MFDEERYEKDTSWSAEAAAAAVVIIVVVVAMALASFIAGFVWEVMR